MEGWGWLDALYFCITTLKTVGLGDLTPVTAAGKLFTILYILVSIGLLSGFIILLVERSGLIKPPATMKKQPKRRSGWKPDNIPPNILLSL